MKKQSQVKTATPAAVVDATIEATKSEGLKPVIKTVNTPGGPVVLMNTKALMDNIGLSRPTLDKYIANGIIKPVKKPGKQPTSYRGRKFMFRQTDVEKLKDFIQNKKATPTTATHTSVSKAEILKRFDMAVAKIAHLERAVKMLAESIGDTQVKH